MSRKKYAKLYSTILLGGAGGLYIATFFIWGEIVTGMHTNIDSLSEYALNIMGALLIMAYIELRSTRAGTWEEISWALACASALGVSLLEGWRGNISAMFLYFIVLLPVALITVIAAKKLFRRKT